MQQGKVNEKKIKYKEFKSQSPKSPRNVTSDYDIIMHTSVTLNLHLFLSITLLLGDEHDKVGGGGSENDRVGLEEVCTVTHTRGKMRRMPKAENFKCFIQ